MNAKHPSIPNIVHDTPDGQPASKNSTMEVWGSDAVAAQLATLDIPFIALNPGASYRGFHDSVVNFLGNRTPQMLLCVHACASAQPRKRKMNSPAATAPRRAWRCRGPSAAAECHGLR